MRILPEIKFYNISVKEKMSLFIIVFVFIGILFLSIFSAKKYFELKDNVEISNQELIQIKKRADVIKLNTSLNKVLINEYIQILSKLIPETEDFFSIIYSLEKISLDSGFIINSYNIDLSSANAERISIIIGGQGDANSFMNFLSNYKFFSGRLITIEKIQFSSGTFSENKISLNFYNKKTISNDQIIPQFSKKDLKLLEEIRNKITFTLKVESEPSFNESYPVKSNPF